MAVPKKKTSKSRRNKRRSHDSLKPLNIITDKDTGEYRLPHHVDKTNGVYNNNTIFSIKIKSKNKEEDSE